MTSPRGNTDDTLEEALLEVRLVVPPDRDRWRLDRFLRDKIPRLSRTRLQLLIAREVRGPNDEKLKASHKVRCGEVISLYRTPPAEPPVPTTFAVLYEDESLYVVDKPAGLPVHPTARYHRHTLTWLLRERFGEKRPIVVHRLDRETSGVLVCAKDKAAERDLKRQFESRTVEKTYLAVVRGSPTFAEIRIDIPLGPALGSEVRIKVGPRHDELGQPASTDVTTLERLGDCALVVAKPLTGRQHQIRAHLAAVGHPVVGDKIYGDDERYFVAFVDAAKGLSREDWERLEMKRQALHAHRVVLRHPATGSLLAIGCPLAEDIDEFLRARRRSSRDGRR